MIEFINHIHYPVSVFLTYTFWILFGLGTIYQIGYSFWCWIDDRTYRGYITNNSLDGVEYEIFVYGFIAFILSLLSLLWLPVLIILMAVGLSYIGRYVRRRGKEGDSVKTVYRESLIEIKSFIKK